MSSSCSFKCGLLREATTIWREGMAAFAKGEVERAEAMQRKALSLVFSLGGFSVIQARIHNNLGVILACTGRGAEAGREFNRALYLMQGRVAPDTRFHQIVTGNYRATLEPPQTVCAHSSTPYAAQPQATNTAAHAA